MFDTLWSSREILNSWKMFNGPIGAKKGTYSLARDRDGYRYERVHTIAPRLSSKWISRTLNRVLHLRRFGLRAGSGNALTHLRLCASTHRPHGLQAFRRSPFGVAHVQNLEIRCLKTNLTIPVDQALVPSITRITMIQ